MKHLAATLVLPGSPDHLEGLLEAIELFLHTEVIDDPAWRYRTLRTLLAQALAPIRSDPEDEITVEQLRLFDPDDLDGDWSGEPDEHEGWELVA